MKQLIIFDLDGTLTESKSPLNPEMGALLAALLQIMQVAVISGGSWDQYQSQFLPGLPDSADLEKLCGTKFYHYRSGWKPLYSGDFSAAEKKRIMDSLQQVMPAPGTASGEHWGEVIEDRGSQITFSALGQRAPLAAKKQWDPDFAKRTKMKARLDELLPGFSVRMGGTTSIDITKPGIDNAYGIRKLRDTLGIAITDLIFVGDALFPGGNDSPAKEAGVVSIQVRDPDGTRCVIETVLACLENPCAGREEARA
jgi:phosphomannomutase